MTRERTNFVKKLRPQLSKQQRAAAEEKKRRILPNHPVTSATQLISGESHELAEGPASENLLPAPTASIDYDARMIERKNARFNEQRCSRHLTKVARRVLHIVDAALPQGKQNQAVKTLVALEFQKELSKVFHEYYDGGLSASEAGDEPDPVQAFERDK